MSLVSTDWLEKNIKSVKVIDSSWHLPTTNRNPFEEYNHEHISNAIFFDMEKNSDPNTDLPHMLPNKSLWEQIISSLGISNTDKVIIYDNSDLISSCRCWYSFIYFGHDPKLVSILDGGLKKWKLEKRVTTNEKTILMNSKYSAQENIKLVKNKKQIDVNILNPNFKLIDARSKERFEGKEKEFRKGLKSGSIPNSVCIPHKEFINEDHSFKEKKEILKIFETVLGSDLSSHPVFTCGSGVTASVLALAYSLIDNTYKPVVYDGSWSEYGKYT